MHRIAHRWFVLKQGKIFWFKSDIVNPDSQPRGVIEVLAEQTRELLSRILF